MKIDTLAVLKIPEFRHFILGRFIFIMGLRMFGTLISWWLYEITGDPFYIGMIGLAEALPAVGLALYAGYVIDKSEKRKLLLTTVVLYAICVMIMLISSMNEDGISNKILLSIIYGVVFLTGAIRSFSGPSFGAMIASIVPRQQLATAAQLSSTTWLVGSISGHAVVGFLIALLGVSGTFMVILAFVLTGFGFLTHLRQKPPNKQEEQRRLEAVTEGLRYVFKSRELLGAISLDLFAVLFGGAVAMVPVFAKDILKVGPIGFGWLNAAMDIGSIIMVLALTFKPLKKNQGKKLIAAVAGFGIFIIIFAISEWFWLSFLALMMSGVMDGVSVVIRGNIMQLKTPDHLRGRVMSVNSMFINSSNEIGQFESGLAARLMGNVTSVIFGGSMTLAIALFTWFKSPALRKLEY